MTAKPTDKCFKCGVEFDVSCAVGGKDWPSLIFDSTGNWGSTIFDQDPFGKPVTWMRIRICDKCVVDGRDLVQVIGDETMIEWQLRDDVSKYLDEASRKQVVELASKALGTDRAESWMSSSIQSLGGKTPESVLKEPDGAKKVMLVLQQIEFGVYG